MMDGCTGQVYAWLRRRDGSIVTALGAYPLIIASDRTVTALQVDGEYIAQLASYDPVARKWFRPNTLDVGYDEIQVMADCV